MVADVRSSPGTARIRVMDAGHFPAEAMADLWRGLMSYEIWSRFAFHDIRQRFRRSILGPFWLTLSMGIMVGALGLVFGTLFQQNIGETLPHIATGLIFWGLLTSCINDGTTVFVGSANYIRNLPLPISLHVYQMLCRNLIIWGFNMAIYLLVAVVFRLQLTWDTLLFIPGFILFVFNLSWIALVAGIFSTRFRDIPQLILNLIQVVFFVTPVFWSVENLPRRPAFVMLNPFYHLLEIVRAPLLGTAPGLVSWAVAGGLAVFGTFFATWLYRRTYSRIAYWV